MKILHLISSLDAKSGGTSWACARICHAQVAYGDLAPAIAYTFSENDDPEVVEWLGNIAPNIPLYALGPTSSRLRNTPQLSKTVKSLVEQHDIVHVHGLWEEIQWRGHRCGSVLGKPVVLSPHGMLSSWSLAQSGLKKRAYWLWRWGRQISKTSCVHALTRSEERQLCWVDEVRRLVEPIGIDFPSEDCFAKEPVPGKMRLLFLSRLHPGKRLHFLLHVLSKLQGYPWQLTVAGGGAASYVEQTRTLVQQLGLKERVELVGQVTASEREKLLQRSHLMLLPSEHENFGLVVLEALSYRVQVLLSPHVAVAEELDKSCNVFTEPLVPELWEQRIRKLLEIFAQNGANLKSNFQHDWGVNRFDWSQIGRNWRQSYTEIIRRKPVTGVVG